jgi:hypothetical protein
VAGTEQAQEAVLDAQVPQTSAVKRNDKSLKVEYDGKPQFKDIEDTDMEYAVNTSYSVIKAQDRYYCCHEAVWYEAADATGPWAVCADVPDEIYTIPPSCPHYNVKYVYVYDATPDVVYVGYYPGYMGSYIYGPTVVYGTGWWYDPWWGYAYYPRPVTYGFHVRYNPWYGWSFGFSFSTGPFTFGIGWGGFYGGWWGPGMYRPYPHYAYSAGFRAGYRAGYWSSPRVAPGRRNIGQVNINRNIYNRSTNIQRNVSRGQLTRPTQQPRIAQGQANNVLADRNGNVLRRTDSGWQKREGKKWSPSSSNLNRQLNARQRGTLRTNSFQGRASGGRIRRR